MSPTPPRYHVRPATAGGWMVWEDCQPLAYCGDNEAAARAICQALNLQRSLLVAVPRAAPSAALRASLVARWN